jgi:hypothetical protein
LVLDVIVCLLFKCKWDFRAEQRFLPVKAEVWRIYFSDSLPLVDAATGRPGFPSPGCACAERKSLNTHVLT